MGLLSSRSDLGIHSGLFSDGLIDLLEGGAITGARKGTAPGVSIVTEAIGTAHLYRWLDYNEHVLFAPASYTHSPNVLSQQHQLVAISSAIEVALDGSVNAETVRGRRISGGFLVSALQSALVVALIGAFASLLSSSVADAMTREVHDPNRELIGQGLGNMVSGLIGGLPGGATVLTTVVNIRAGGRSPVAGVIVALLMLAVALGAGRLALPAARPSAASRSSRGDGDDTDRDDLCGCTDVITAVAIGLILAGMANAARLESMELSGDIGEQEVVIFDFTRTSEFDDSTVRVLEQLFHRAEENNSPSIVAGLRGAPADALESIGALDMIPNERRVATLEEARALADRLLLEISPQNREGIPRLPEESPEA